VASLQKAQERVSIYAPWLAPIRGCYGIRLQATLDYALTESGLARSQHRLDYSAGHYGKSNSRLAMPAMWKCILHDMVVFQRSICSKVRPLRVAAVFG
jgi:hypothetical protein